MPIVTISTLGKRGRVGNSLFQYCFAKAYAESMGCDLQYPDDWWGRKIFVSANDPPITIKLPRTQCDSAVPYNESYQYFFGAVNIDIYGFFQNQCFLNFYTRKKAREYLRLKPEYQDMLDAIKSTTVAHLRRGDFQDSKFRNLYCTVSKQSYERAINKFGIPRPVSYISGGIQHEDWMERERNLEFLPDWLRMVKASHLLRAPSSFSWWAAVLCDGKVYSPIVEDKVGDQNWIEFTEGNWPNLAGKHKNQSNLHLRDE